MPGIGTLAATCQTGIAGESYLTLTPAAGASPFASVTAYQGEGVDNSVQTDYYTDPTSDCLGRYRCRSMECSSQPSCPR